MRSQLRSSVCLSVRHTRDLWYTTQPISTILSSFENIFNLYLENVSLVDVGESFYAQILGRTHSGIEKYEISTTFLPFVRKNGTTATNRKSFNVVPSESGTPFPTTPK